MRGAGPTIAFEIYAVDATDVLLHTVGIVYDMEVAEAICLAHNRQASEPDFIAIAEEAIRYVADDEMRVSADTPFMVKLLAAYQDAVAPTRRDRVW